MTEDHRSPCASTTLQDSKAYLVLQDSIHTVKGVMTFPDTSCRAGVRGAWRIAYNTMVDIVRRECQDNPIETYKRSMKTERPDGRYDL